jgi:hypothetical protein
VAAEDPELPVPALPPGAGAEEREFQDLEIRVWQHLFRLSPASAVFLGLHAYDGRLPDLSGPATSRWVSEARNLLHQLQRVPAKSLPGRRALDRDLLVLSLEGGLFDLETYPYLDRLPLWYIFPLSLIPYVSRPYAPWAQRAQAIVRLWEGIPGFLRTAKSRLRGPLPEPFLRVGREMGAGLPSHFREVGDLLQREVPEYSGPASRALKDALFSVQEFLDHLNTSSSDGPETDGRGFALGPERYQELLRVREGVKTPWRGLLDEGWRDLRRNQERLQELARRLHPPTDAPGAARRLAGDHPNAEGLLEEARQFTREVRQFVLDQQLVSIPGPDACRVEETPPFERAFSTASLNPPGPFEPQISEGIYYVTPVDPAWTPEQQRQWLEYFNRPLFRNVTAHEVYPGHYLQFLHFRASADTLTARSYVSSAFTEGWAHYAEQLMVEAGFHGESPEAEIAQVQDALLRDVRLLVSVGLHAGGMSLEEATRLFQTEAYLERFPAEREALRGTFNPEYFCYTLGKLEILRARHRWRERNPRSPLREFHDRLLSFGAPPVGLLASLLE